MLLRVQIHHDRRRGERRHALRSQSRDGMSDHRQWGRRQKGLLAPLFKVRILVISRVLHGRGQFHNVVRRRKIRRRDHVVTRPPAHGHVGGNGARAPADHRDALRLLGRLEQALVVRYLPAVPSDSGRRLSLTAHRRHHDPETEFLGLSYQNRRKIAIRLVQTDNLVTRAVTQFKITLVVTLILPSLTRKSVMLRIKYTVRVWTIRRVEICTLYATTKSTPHHVTFLSAGTALLLSVAKLYCRNRMNFAYKSSYRFLIQLFLNEFWTAFMQFRTALAAL